MTADRTGTVISFDPVAGLGIVGDPDAREFPFHCIEIADGSRTIAAGTAVRYEIRHKLGRLEASIIRPVGG